MSTAEPGFLVQPGRIEYDRAFEFQHQLHVLRARDEIPDTLVLLEHPPVVTLGKHGDRNNLLVADGELARRGVGVHRIERGGDITFHGPGQLVGYPIFKLRHGVVGVRRFIELVEDALVRALAELGVRADTRAGHIGVWVGNRKIASLGIAVQRSVTLHGFALNATTDLSWFKLMNPCGMAGVEMTSIEREGGVVEMPVVRAAVAAGFERAFGRRFYRNLPRSLTSLTKDLSATAIASASAFE